MGWFTSDRAAQIRTGAAVPTRAERQACWVARDAFFACLDSHSIIDATKGEGETQAKKLCPEELKGFEKDCAAQWVKYFKEWRVADHAKRKRIEQLEKEGAVRMDVKPEFGIQKR